MPAGIAPEAEPRIMRPGASQMHPRDGAIPRDEPNLDSMDFLNFVAAPHERTGIDIPNVNSSRLFTLDDRVADLRQWVGNCASVSHQIKRGPLDPDQCSPGDVTVQCQMGKETHQWPRLMSPRLPNLSARY